MGAGQPFNTVEATFESRTHSLPLASCPGRSGAVPLPRSEQGWFVHPRSRALPPGLFRTVLSKTDEGIALLSRQQ